MASLQERPASVECGRCDVVFVSGGGRISTERFPDDLGRSPQVGTNGLCESCYQDACDRLAVFLFGSGSVDGEPLP